LAWIWITSSFCVPNFLSSFFFSSNLQSFNDLWQVFWFPEVLSFCQKKITSVYIDEYMALCLVLMISSFDLCLVWTHAELWRFEQPAKIDGTLSFLVLGDWGRKVAFKIALHVLQTSLLFFNLYHVFVCLYACRRGVEEKDATCNWHFHLLKSFPLINSCLWFAWIQMRRIKKKLDINFALIPSIFWVDQGQPV
jgi:hypothetical protein